MYMNIYTSTMESLNTPLSTIHCRLHPQKVPIQPQFVPYSIAGWWYTYPF